MVRRLIIFGTNLGGIGLELLGGHLAGTAKDGGVKVGFVPLLLGAVAVIAGWGYCFNWAMRTHSEGWILTDIFLLALALILHPLFGPVRDDKQHGG
jgi:hypothetical protein